MKKSRNIMWIILGVMLFLLFTGCTQVDVTDLNSRINKSSLLKYDVSRGTVSFSTLDGAAVISAAEGDIVKIGAKAEEDYNFVGWSKEAYLDKGGELVSEENDLTITVEKNVKYYANFLKKSEALLFYYANGGTINSKDAKNADVLVQLIDLGKHKYPMTIAQNGTFFREGYNIIEYTSEADGSGVVTNIGQRAFVSNDKIIKLYVQWVKESDVSLFFFEQQEDGCFITKYTGEEKVLSIPSKYNGKTVVGIANSAVASKTIETVILPSSIKSVATDAFKACSSLTKVYLFDTITEMTDASFTDCPIKTVCINSVFEKKYYSVGSGKLELLHYGKDSESNKMVVISGSSGIYGLDSQLLQDSLNKDYMVVNFALQIAVPNTFAMSIAKPYLREGDVIVLAPECETKQFKNVLATTTFTIFDGTYTQIRNVDITKFESFFSALSIFSLAKQSDALNDAAAQFYSDNGDSSEEHAYEEFTSNYTFNSPLHHNTMTDIVYQQYNAVLGELKSMGVKCYLSFAPFCSEACDKNITNELLDEYSSAFGEKLDAIRISNQSDHNYPKKYFFEMFHMTGEGKKHRTLQLVADLNAQFAKE